jgi:Ca2+-binding RTX toxin-like protein
MDGGTGVDLIDHTVFSGNYVFNMTTGVTNFLGESYTNFENATMGAGNDNVTGNASANVINGGAGNDTIDGGAGNDSINGGTGNDSLIGGLGNDSLNGGIGNDILLGGGDGQIDVLTSGGSVDRDTFVLGTAGILGSVLYDSAGNRDFARITDFDLINLVGELASQVDRIQLRGAEANYRLQNGVVAGGFTGVGIFDRNVIANPFDDDLIGLVQGVTAGGGFGQLNLANATQFVYV